MLAYSLKTNGPSKVLTTEQVDDPKPAADEVLVGIQYIGLNYAEIQSRRGLYAWSPDKPYILGMESFGIIEAMGEDVVDRSIGEQVIVAAQYGNYAEKIAVPSRQALPAVPGYTPQENAAFAVNFMTAWVGLKEMLRIRQNDRVLIQAAAGGVGTAAVQLAAAMGARVYGTASTADKCRLIESLGAEKGINYLESDFHAEIRRLTGGRNLDAVIEVVGGEVFRKSLDLLKPFGRLVVMGFASLNLKKWNPVSWWRTWKAIPRVKIADMAPQSQMVGASHLGYLLKNKDLLPRVSAELFSFVQEHDIHPVVGHEYPFSDMPAAHDLMESRKSHGKIVIRVGD